MLHKTYTLKEWIEESENISFYNDVIRITTDYNHGFYVDIDLKGNMLDHDEYYGKISESEVLELLEKIKM